MPINIPHQIKSAVSIFIKYIAPVSIVIGFVLSIYQVWQSRQQQIELTDISGSLSTKYVGTFPHNLELISSLVRSTKRRLWIVCDLPAYGNFSNPAAYAEYKQEIERLRRPGGNVEVRMLVYSSPTRLSSLRNQFAINTPEELKEFKRNDAYKRYFEVFPDRSQPESPEQLYDLIEYENKRFLDELNRKSTLLFETDKQLPVFMWLSDDSQAIVSFYNYGKSPREVSFRTNDQKLIAVLIEIATDAFNGSTPLPKANPGSMSSR